MRFVQKQLLDWSGGGYVTVCWLSPLMNQNAYSTRERDRKSSFEGWMVYPSDCTAQGLYFAVDVVYVDMCMYCTYYYLLILD